MLEPDTKTARNKTRYNLHVTIQAKLLMSLFKFGAERSKSDYDRLFLSATPRPSQLKSDDGNKEAGALTSL